MFFYIGVVAALILSSEMLQYFVRPQNRRCFKAIWGGIILVVLAVCRSINVGVDTPQYVVAYKYAAMLDWKNVIAGTGLGAFEIGYRILMKFFSLIGKSERFFLFWTAVIAIVPVVVFICKYSKSPVLSYIIYVLSGQYFMQIGVIRQSVAFGIALFAVMLAIDKKEHWMFKSLILILIATTVHTAAIVAAAIIFVAEVQKVDFKFYVNCMIATLAIVVCGQFILGRILARFSSYAGYANQSGGIGRIVIVAAIILFIQLYKQNLYREDKAAPWWEKMLCITFSLKAFSYFFAAASRAAALFETSYIVSIPNTIVRIKKRDKVIWTIIILSLFSFFYFTGYDVRNNYVFGILF